MANKDLFINREPSKPNLKRTLFDLSYKSHVSYKEGLVYPCYLQEVPSKSTLVIKPSFAFDFHPMVFPIQNNVKFHMAFYKMPWRILWDNFEDWYSGVGNHAFPIIGRQSESFYTGGVLDHLGIPTVVSKETTALRSFNGDRCQVGYFPISDILLNPRSVDPLLPELVSYRIGYPAAVMSPVLSETSSDGHFYFKFYTTGALNTGTRCSIGIFRRSGQSRSAAYSFEVLEQFALSANTTGIAAEGEAVLGNTSASGAEWVNQSVAGSGMLKSIDLCLESAILGYLNDIIASTSVRIVFIIDAPAATVDLPDRISTNFVSELRESEGKYSTHLRAIWSTPGLVNYFGYNAVLRLTQDSKASNFAIVDGEAPKIPISVLPLRGYDMLRNFVFRNALVDPLIINGIPTYNKFLTNSGDGVDSTTPIDFIRAPYEFDKFTTCLKTPQIGHAPLIGISVRSESQVTMTFKPDEGEEYTVGVAIGADGNAIGISNYDEVADKPNIHRLEQIIAAGISINDMRNTNAYQVYCERMAHTSFLYENVVQEFFGVRPPTGDHFPEYIGGVTRDVLVSKIQNMAQSEGNALGEFAGTANVTGRGESIEVFCAEQSYIMGVCWFTVTPVYSQMLQRHYTKFSKLDLYNPTFANIGPQPVYKYEINPLALTDGHYNDVFGYNRPFVDLVSRQDEVHGDFRTTMFNFIQQRFFPNAPDLGRDLIYMNPDELADVFAVSSDTDKIYGILNFDVLGELPIPRISIPSLQV